MMSNRRKWLAATIASVAAFVTVAATGLPASASECSRVSVGLTPLSDLRNHSYQGYQGGLYPAGSDQRPLAHTMRGEMLARNVAPRDAQGTPSSGGKVVFLAIGMSNASAEAQALISLASTDPVRDRHVAIVNGAEGGMDAAAISSPSSTYWPYVDQQLHKARVTGAQVQAVWLKEAISHPVGGFPSATQQLEQYYEQIVSILGQRFPNLRLVYVSSRIYAGYAGTDGPNPEPYAYQSGFAVKWLVAKSISQDATQKVPWVNWGPYLWADGMRPRSDGLTWQCSDFMTDGTHPSTSGANKVASRILNMLHTDPTAKTWYEGSSTSWAQSPVPLSSWQESGLWYLNGHNR